MNPPITPDPAGTPQALKQHLYNLVVNLEPAALKAALPALHALPNDPDVLLLSAIAALLAEKPEYTLRYVQRFTKNWRPHGLEDQLLQIVALAQQGLLPRAAQLVGAHDLRDLYRAFQYLPGTWALRSFFHRWLNKIERHADSQKRSVAADKAAERKRAEAKKSPTPKKAAAPVAGKAAAKAKRREAPAVTVAAPVLETVCPPLPRYEFPLAVKIEIPAAVNTALAVRQTSDERDLTAFRLRYELAQLGLLQGFDELLCLPLLQGVETYWYQLETVRKVLKQFRGRVLLADEVGLGKTIEAGMVLKEYLLRGMAERVLILTPATLVGQWQEELAVKFNVPFATTYDSLLRNDPAAFWAQPRVIASLATARRAEHQERLAAQHYDLVIVDEAHHLKNRATANWKLVNALQQRFLLLLSATPVQNSLVELFNLLTLLKPGIFKTEKEFRARYMTAGKPRVPANKEHMRDLMRDVMIRNTRALVEVKLPPRHATTLRLEPTAAEHGCYLALTELVAQAHRQATTQQRLALRYLLSAAGSTSATAAHAIARYSEHNRTSHEWRKLHDRYANAPSSKEQALLELLQRNPTEKKLVFVHHRETLHRLAALLNHAGLACAQFEGSMSGPQKDAAVARFRDEVPLLLCTESGGEGRNLQFCNTLINFDLPWNPMAIEQRIGRIHRIGQPRDVFVFNLAVRDTLEEHVLRILDEKINMFELVVGEIGEILGELDDEQDFAELVFAAWVETTAAERGAAFEQLGAKLVEAKQQYDEVKVLDEELFGEEFVTG